MTCLDEAALAIQSGLVDALIVQGSEAGGHRGSFEIPRSGDDLLTDELAEASPTHRLVDAISCEFNGDRFPLIAAGGIVNHYDAFDLMRPSSDGQQRAAGVLVGTALLLTQESGATAPYMHALRYAGQHRAGTRWIRGFSGRYARGLPNAAACLLEAVHKELLVASKQGAGDLVELDNFVFPTLNAATRSMRQRAGATTSRDSSSLAAAAHRMSLWAGTCHERAFAEYHEKSDTMPVSTKDVMKSIAEGVAAALTPRVAEAPS